MTAELLQSSVSHDPSNHLICCSRNISYHLKKFKTLCIIL